MEDQNSNFKLKPGIKSVLFKQDFFKLWLGQFISNTGSNISGIILPLFIYAYSGSIFWFGVITFAQFFPIIVFSTLAGMYVDSHNRKYILIASDLLRAFLMILVPIVIAFDQLFSQIEFFSLITILVFFISTVNRFFYPARQASIPRLVEKEELGIAISITQTTFSLLIIFGPILGVVLATSTSYSYGFIVDSLTFIFSAFMIALIKTDLAPIKTSDEKASSRPSILLGAKKIWEIKTIKFLTLSLGLTTLAISSLNAFGIVFDKSILNMSDFQFGLSISLLGVFSVLTGLIVTKLMPKINRPLLLITLGFLMASIDTLPYIFITNVWQLYIMTSGIGVINMFVNIPMNYVLLRDTTDNVRGQVTSTFSMVFSSINILGLIYGTIFIPIIGIRLLFFLNGIIMLVIGVVGISYLLFVNNLDNLPVQLDSTNQDSNIRSVA